MSLLPWLCLGVFAVPRPAAPRVISKSLVQADRNRCHIGRVELCGPLVEVVLVVPSDGPDRGQTRILAELRAGEVRTVRVPFESRPLSGRPEVVSIEPVSGGGAASADGRVEFLGFVDDASVERPGSPGLRARTLPPVAAVAGRVRFLDLGWLLAVGALVIGLRRRPVFALVAGLVGAAGVAGLRRTLPGGRARVVAVLEGDFLDPSGTLIEASVGRWSLTPAGLASDPIWATTRPTGARLDWTLDLRLGGLGGPGGPGELMGEAHGALVVGRVLSQPSWSRLDPADNDWAALTQVWTRNASGGWSARGPWPLGTPLAPALGAGGMPPGWLASGLPPGRSVLVGRVLPGSAAVPGPWPTASEIWLRASGF